MANKAKALTKGNKPPPVLKNAEDKAELYENWTKLLTSKDLSKIKEGCDMCLQNSDFLLNGGGLDNLMKILVHQVLLDPKKSKWQGVFKIAIF